MIKKLLLMTVIVSATLSCTKKDDQATSDKAEKPKIEVTSLVQEAWLSQRLPGSALAYIRVPNTWNFFSADKNSFYYAQGNAEHVKQIEQIQQAVMKYAAKNAPGHMKPLAELLLKHMTSPLELAVLPPQEGAQMPSPSVLGSTLVNFSNNEAFKLFVDTLAASNPMVNLIQPVDGNGNAALMVGPAMISLQFNSEQRLTFYAGMNAAPDALTGALASLPPTSAESFTKLANQVDGSGKGLYIWLNSEAAMPMVQGMAPPHAIKQLEMFGLNQMKGLAIGMGTSQNKGRLMMVIDMPAHSGFRKFIPTAQESITLQTVGSPRMVAQLSLPTKAQMQEIIKESAKFSTNGQSDFDAMNMRYKEKFGVDLLSWFDAYGDLIVFKDDLGYFMAQKIRDPIGYKKLALDVYTWIKRLDAGHAEDLDYLPEDASQREMVQSMSSNVALTSRNINGTEIFHLAIPSFYAGALANKEVEGEALLDMLAGGDTHLYWVLEGDYMVASTLPQPLIERGKADKTTSIAKWQKESDLNNTNSLLSVSGSMDQGNVQLYHYYLSLLTYIADVVDAEFDIFAFPPASELQLDENSVYGFQLDSDGNYLKMTFTYEQSLLDPLLVSENSMAMVATAGVLAAVAIPAYQDYTVRAGVASVISETKPVQAIIREMYLTNGRFPSAEELQAIPILVENQWVAGVEVEPDTGIIAIWLSGHAQTDGKMLRMLPQETGDGLVFTCESELAQKYLPKSCR